MFTPGYVYLSRTGELEELARKAVERLRKCEMCPRRCGVNRLKDETGVCRTGRMAVVSSFHPHFGEEPPLVGYGGSGTIFFTHCNLRCKYCQNYEISHLGEGRKVSSSELADMMLSLQDVGCHNINLVTPSHVVPQILEALDDAAARGLEIPIVYNTSSYDSPQTLRLLDGVVDIYLPDAKYWEKDTAGRLSGAPDYPDVMKDAIREMFRQVGHLETRRVGDVRVAERGVLVRHLVLPGHLDETLRILEWLGKEFPGAHVNVMDQYWPAYRAREEEELRRRVTRKEMRAALAKAKEMGLNLVY